MGKGSGASGARGKSAGGGRSESNTPTKAAFTQKAEEWGWDASEVAEFNKLTELGLSTQWREAKGTSGAMLEIKNEQGQVIAQAYPDGVSSRRRMLVSGWGPLANLGDDYPYKVTKSAVAAIKKRYLNVVRR